jgi:hypothetical protein
MKAVELASLKKVVGEKSPYHFTGEIAAYG